MDADRLGRAHARSDLSRALDGAAQGIRFVVGRGAGRTQQALGAQRALRQQIRRRALPRCDGREQMRARHPLLSAPRQLFGELA